LEDKTVAIPSFYCIVPVDCPFHEPSIRRYSLSMRDEKFRALIAMLALVAGLARAQSVPPRTVLAPTFKILALAEAGGHHIAFTAAAKPWLKKCGEECGFEVDYIPNFSAGTVRVEDKAHPCMKGVPSSLVIGKEEWHTYDRSPRPNVHVLASVDESTCSDAGAVRMGDHPVIWTNERMAARNVYVFMGHGPWLLESEAFTPILRNAILWAAETKPK
jgi:hypothetical protein